MYCSRFSSSLHVLVAGSLTGHLGQSIEKFENAQKCSISMKALLNRVIYDQSLGHWPHLYAADDPISIDDVTVRPGSLEGCLSLGTETPLTLALAYLKTIVQRIDTTITIYFHHHSLVGG
jgi:hypothetical protein